MIYVWAIFVIHVIIIKNYSKFNVILQLLHLMPFSTLSVLTGLQIMIQKFTVNSYFPCLGRER